MRTLAEPQHSKHKRTYLKIVFRKLHDTICTVALELLMKIAALVFFCNAAIGSREYSRGRVEREQKDRERCGAHGRAPRKLSQSLERGTPRKSTAAR